MGEIGIPYYTFYYDLRWWEVKAIIRGYNARHHHSWEQARLISYNAHYCMGSKDPIPTVTNWLPFPWEQKAVKAMDEREVRRIHAEIAAMNAVNA